MSSTAASWHCYWTVGDTTSRSPDTPSKETHNFIPKQNVVYNYTPPPPPHITEHKYSLTSDGSLSANCHHHHRLPPQAALVHELQTKQQNAFSEFIYLSLSQQHKHYILQHWKVRHYTDSLNLMTTAALIKWWVTLVLHTNRTHVLDQVVGTALCFVSLPFSLHSSILNASTPLCVNSQ